MVDPDSAPGTSGPPEHLRTDRHCEDTEDAPQHVRVDGSRKPRAYKAAYNESACDPHRRWHVYEPCPVVYIRSKSAYRRHHRRKCSALRLLLAKRKKEDQNRNEDDTAANSNQSADRTCKESKNQEKHIIVHVSYTAVAMRKRQDFRVHASTAGSVAIATGKLRGTA